MTTSDSLVIRAATIYDGTGATPRQADITIHGPRITALVPAGTARGDRVIDAEGLCACPGFIDIHSHSDMALAHPDAPDLLAPFVAQGITTQVIGNCGLGVAPAPGEQRDALAAFMALILPNGVPFAWETYPEYLHHLEARGLPLNAVPLVAHGALRCAVMGSEPGPAPSAQLAAIIALLEEALAAGAFGLSAGLIYPPGMWSDTDELVALCESVARIDGLFCCHIRGSSELAIEATEELLEIGRRTGVRVQHSHHEAFGAGYWHLARETMRLEDEARANGIDIASDVVPYHAVNTSLLAIYPPWALAGGVDSLCKRLGDSSQRQRIAVEIAEHRPRWPPWQDGWAHNLVRAGGWDNIVVLQAASDQHRDWIGHSLTSIAEREKRSPFECAAEITRAAAGNVMARYHAISGAPGDDGVLHDLMCHPAHAIGVDVILKGEGISHPGGHGAMPRLLGHYARDDAWLPLAEAIRKVTVLPAARLRLNDRGRLAPGMAADVVLFDAEVVAETGTYSTPDSPPVGIRRVLLNGRTVAQEGIASGERCGRVLRYRMQSGSPRNSWLRTSP